MRPTCQVCTNLRLSTVSGTQTHLLRNLHRTLDCNICYCRTNKNSNAIRFVMWCIKQTTGSAAHVRAVEYVHKLLRLWTVGPDNTVSHMDWDMSQIRVASSILCSKCYQACSLVHIWKDSLDIQFVFCICILRLFLSCSRVLWCWCCAACCVINK